MRYSIKRTSGPAAEPLTLAAAKDHLRVDTADDDALIAALLAASREDCEGFTGRCFVWSAWEMKLDAFPTARLGEIRLPRPPLIRVDSVKYIDSDGAEQTVAVADYQVDSNSEPARIRPAYGKSWPTPRAQFNAVTIAYVAGYAAGEGSPTDYAANVPESIKAAIKLQMGHLHENREAVNVGNIVTEIPLGVRNLLWMHRVIDYGLSA